MKLRALCFLLGMSGCAQRPLDASLSTTTTTTTPDEPACTNHPFSVLVADTGGGIAVDNFVSDGTNVYYANLSSISSVPVHGGTVTTLGQTFTQYLTLQDQHLYYSLDGCDTFGAGCPAIVEYDLATAQLTTYDTPSYAGSVVPTASALFGFSLGDVQRVDRASGSSTDNLLSTDVESVPAVLGTHAFYWGSDDSAQRYDLTTGAIDAALPPSSGVTAVATDGVSIIASTSDAFVAINEDEQPVSTLPHDVGVLVGPLAADAAALYWAAFDDPNLHIATRATGESCYLALPGVSISTLAQDEHAVYAVVLGTSNGTTMPAPLLRIEK
jgi:hypothetical protein